MADSGKPPNMTPQEEELLKYLEDLQQNNPAEYEMLVKDLQEKDVAKNGGKPGANSQGEQVTPTPGFVAKTRSATRKGAKVFINVCSSDHVDAPAPVETAGQASDEVQMRIPMSLGPPREDLDKSGEVCNVYDVVFHPDAVDGALKEAEFRSFVMQLTLHQIQQKHEDELSLHDITYPKVKGNYKGIAPLPQFMRKKGVPPPPPPGSEPPPAADDEAKSTQPKPLVEELAAPSDESLPAPSYAVEPRRVASGEGEPDALAIKAHLPQVDDASEIELKMSSEQLELLVPSLCRLSLQLPQLVRLPPISAKFEAERRVLSLLVRTDAAASLDAGVSDGSAGADASLADDEMSRREREREARLNARRRRAAGDKQLRRQAAAVEAAEAAADGPEANASDGAVAEEDVGSSEAAGSEVATGEAATGEVAASVDAPKESKEIGGPIELTNSIMFELED